MKDSSVVELALGTAQFGMPYGIAGRGEVIPVQEAREIFSRAWALGIHILDTAAAYGNIEKELINLIDDQPFSIISKISAFPQEANESAVVDHVCNSIDAMQKYLGSRLKTILFHRSDDLLGQYGNVAWKAAETLAGGSMQLGVSCYSPEELLNLCTRFPIKVAQLPGSALDQRLVRNTHEIKVEIHLRSVFLQGILLLEEKAAINRLPSAASALKSWHTWCNKHEMKPLQAALSIAKGLPGVRYCVVGVDRLSQLEEISDAWLSAKPLLAEHLAVHDLSIIDPRCWCLHPH